ncbi:MAG: Rrf2 family transcriptional regulator [Eubacteriales bacterium]|nr:Rrf2 family transcriptional regulator [Eubacteriales bacterium]
MKLSTRAIYGLRALIDLGLHSETEAVSIQSIATRQSISVSYLEQLMALLKKAGIVVSSRGASGGYRLGRPATEISVGDILRVLEGGLEAVKCGGETRDNACQNPQEKNGCQGADVCVARFVWKRINDSITDAVDTMMLSDLIEESREAHSRCGKESNNQEVNHE